MVPMKRGDKPQLVGDTYADIVTWKWNRERSRWVAVLQDGTELIVQFHKRRRGSYWSYFVNFLDYNKNDITGTGPYCTPTEAEQAAVAAYLERRRYFERRSS